MTPQDQRGQFLLENLSRQRESALNEVARLGADLAILQMQNAELTTRLEKLTAAAPENPAA
jgi:hypothetical protein